MRVSPNVPWHNVIQWTGAEAPSVFKAFFEGPDGLHLGQPVTITVAGDTLYADWGRYVGPTPVPLGHWVISLPSWGADVTPGMGTVVPDGEYQGRYSEIL